MKAASLFLIASLAACATTAPVHLNYDAFVDATDRIPADRLLDPGRKPGLYLAFMAPQPGMAVADLGAGSGYTSELLARAVGPTGTVYSQNSPFIVKRFADKPWTERLQRPMMKNTVRVEREFDDPIPPDAKPLDLVVMNAEV